MGAVALLVLSWAGIGLAATVGTTVVNGLGGFVYLLFGWTGLLPDLWIR